LSHISFNLEFGHNDFAGQNTLYEGNKKLLSSSSAAEYTRAINVKLGKRLYGPEVVLVTLWFTVPVWTSGRTWLSTYLGFGFDVGFGWTFWLLATL
jgi:hypothetical protein